MPDRQKFYVGSVLDIPLNRGLRVNVEGKEVVVFRETSGRLFALEDRILGIAGPISNGMLEAGRIRLRYGKTIDARTGQCDDLDCFVQMFPSWVEGSFVFVRAYSLAEDEMYTQEGTMLCSCH